MSHEAAKNSMLIPIPVQTVAGIYALIINPILSSVLIFTISFQHYPQHLRYTLGLTALRKIFSYSAYQFLFNVINYFSRNLDKLLIGKYMGISDRKCQYPEYGYGRQPLVAENNQCHFFCCKEK